MTAGTRNERRHPQWRGFTPIPGNVACVPGAPRAVSHRLATQDVGGGTSSAPGSERILCWRPHAARRGPQGRALCAPGYPPPTAA